MPELPEVTTTVKGINDECSNWTIIDVWTDLAVNKPSRIDFYQTIKYLPYFQDFSKKVINQKIVNAKRRGKNILINLKNNKTLKSKDSDKAILVHMKMTGHMMVGLYDYDKKNNKWHVHKSEKNEALHDPYNRFVHVVFTIQKGKNLKHLVLCDSRKFAKVTLIENENHHNKHLGNHGPEPIDPDISYTEFIKALDNAPANNRAIKSLLMDTRTIAGIGNIYSDEILFESGIHPESVWSKIPTPVRKSMHKNTISILRYGIDLGGDSMSDYRNIYGKRGEFQNNHKAYRRTGEKCSQKKCRGTIEKKTIAGRSSHFCDTHQKIYK